MNNVKRKGVAGAVVAGVIAVLWIVFEENVASLIEAVGLNKVWILIQPAFKVVIAALRFLIHPIMTHLYALGIGIAASVLGVRFLLKASQDQSEPDTPITLIELVTYLREKSSWAAQQAYIGDREIELLLTDALAHGQLRAFARKKDQYDQTYPLRPVDNSYFEAVRIDVEAISARRSGQIVPKMGYFADTFEDWQFSRNQVESLWPPEKPPGSSGRRAL